LIVQRAPESPDHPGIEKDLFMSNRKDAIGLVLGAIILSSSLGCAELPPVAEEPKDKCSGSTPPPRIREGQQIASDLRVASGGVQNPGMPTPSTQPVIRASATNSAQQGPDLPPLGSRGLQQPGSSPSAPVPEGDGAIGKLRALHRQAAERYGAIDSYIVRMRRREQVNGRDKPEEILLVKFRKQPWSVYFKWLGNEGKGREVIYVRGQNEDKMQTLLAAGDMPLASPGKRIAISPDNPLARGSSRHSIREAGTGALIDSFGILVDAAQKKDPRYGTLTDLGLLRRPEFSSPCEAVEQKILPGAEPQLPRGGRRLWAFDTSIRFPVLIITQNELGQEVEYYCYDLFQFPVRLDDDDFNPDKLWPKKKP
jgi:hypothetical protein